jgi:osmotically-inducible protein OsmY
MAVEQQTTEKKVPRQRLAPARERVVPRPSTSIDEDELICLAVERLLRSSDHCSVREVRSFVENGAVMLFGTVSSYYVKQVVQSVVMKLELVERVENLCEVERVASPSIAASGDSTI